MLCRSPRRRWGASSAFLAPNFGGGLPSVSQWAAHVPQSRWSFNFNARDLMLIVPPVLRGRFRLGLGVARGRPSAQAPWEVPLRLDGNLKPRPVFVPVYGSAALGPPGPGREGTEVPRPRSLNFTVNLKGTEGSLRLMVPISAPAAPQFAASPLQWAGPPCLTAHSPTL